MSVTYFPQLGGITTQLPYNAGMAFFNNTVDMPSGAHYSYGEITSPLGRWQVNFPSISDTNLATLWAFFRAQYGQYGIFTFLDPNGNLVQASENFSDASWTNTAVGSLTTGAADPFKGTLGTVLTPSSSSVQIITPCLPGGSGAGITLCASVWIKTASGPFDVILGFVDATAGPLLGQEWTIDSNWRRIQCQITLTTNGVIKVYLSSALSWTTQPVTLFGFQVAPTFGPGAYNKTPGNYGVHSKCSFGTDDFKVVKLGYNESAVAVLIQEFN